MTLAPGDAIDRYRVLSVLGEGGMAVVYEVEHRTLGTRHALKVLTVHHPEVQRRLVQEGRVQAQLRHPNIVPVTDVVMHQEMPGLLMEYIEGIPLELVLRYVHPTLLEALQIFQAVLSAVEHAHVQGLVHRDLKPANVLLQVTPHGIVPRVADFGIAKVAAEQGQALTRTRTGTTMGTPAYMSPEQIRDASTVDHRADLYSLGCLLYELVCGRPPFDQEDMLALFAAVAEGRYVPPHARVEGLPHEIAHTIEQLLQVDRDDRPESCNAVMALLDGEPHVGPIRPPDPLPLDGPVGNIVREMVRRKEGKRTPIESAEPSWVPTPPRHDETPRAPKKSAWGPLGGAVLLLTVGGAALTIVAVAMVIIADIAGLVDLGTLLGRQDVEAPPALSETAAPYVEPVAAAPDPVAAPPPGTGRATAPRPRITPPPEPTPEPGIAAPADASVLVEGDASEVILRSPHGLSFRPGDALDPGTYTILARWTEDGELVEAGSVRVRDRQVVTVQCSASQGRCAK